MNWPDRTNRQSRRSRWATLVAVVLAMAGLGWLFSDYLTLETLADREDSLREFAETQPWRSGIAAFVLYVSVTALSLPGALVLSLTFAWILGFWPALFIVSFASTTGATVSFLLSRYVLGDVVRRRYAQRMIGFDERWRREGLYYLLVLRLAPVVPFFLVNLLMGLTPVRVRDYWWVSQIGMLPGTMVYLYAGASVPSLQTLAASGTASIMTPRLVVAFGLLAVVPLLIRKVIAKWSHPAAVE